MRVEKNIVDSHGQSEVAFAFCHLLDTVRLMPRLKRIKYERLYVPGNAHVDTWWNLRGVLVRSVRWDLIAARYDEMICATVALKDGTASAEAILKRYNSYNRSHPTYRAFVEVGSVPLRSNAPSSDRSCGPGSSVRTGVRGPVGGRSPWDSM